MLKKNSVIIFLVTLLLFTPALAQYITVLVGNYFFGMGLRALVHIAVPIFGVMLFTDKNFWQAFFTPLSPPDKKKFKKYFLFGSILAFLFIVGAFIILQATISFVDISGNLKNNYGVNTKNYIFIGLLLVLLNPFLEEYFWRGFIYRVYDKYVSQNFRFLMFVITGIMFSLHHVIIISGWFNLWQFLLVTVFLAGVGIYFNWLYKKTGSIYTGWAIHTVADIILVILGFIILF